MAARLAAVPFVRVQDRSFCIVPAAAELQPPDNMPALWLRTDDAQRDNVEHEGTEKSPPFDFVIIHLRQFQRFTSEMLTDDLIKSLENIGLRVVITSGRGNLLEGALAQLPFLEFSVLEACVVKELDKIQLGNVLMSIM